MKNSLHDDLPSSDAIAVECYLCFCHHIINIVQASIPKVESSNTFTGQLHQLVIRFRESFENYINKKIFGAKVHKT